MILTVGFLQDFVYLGTRGRRGLINRSIPQGRTEIGRVRIVVDLPQHVFQGTQCACQGRILVGDRTLPNSLFYQFAGQYRVRVGCSIVNFDRTSLICQSPRRCGCTMATGRCKHMYIGGRLGRVGSLSMRCRAGWCWYVFEVRFYVGEAVSNPVNFLFAMVSYQQQ